MMNRGVMQRQMFAAGGAAFPDLTGDGRVTQADILKGRGVEFKQEGGIAGMMPPEMNAVPGMAGAMAAQTDMPTQAVSQAAGAMDPAVLEQMLGTVDEGIQNLDNAQDYETVMNSVRGDDASIQERYAELAGVVGEQDAAQTPESVLTLVQPVMMLNAVDQGVGGLAQAEMTAPVEGAMAEGIMSTVGSPPQPAAPDPAGMGGPPPVNFKDGGLVRRGDNQPVQMYAPGGEVQQFFGPRTNITPDQSALLRQQINYDNMAKELAIAQGAPTVRPLKEIFDETKGTYASLLGGEDKRASDLEEQKNLTQAQMLFDIANTALAFAAPMEGEQAGMSAAERLAMAARSTQLPQTIGARAQQQLEAKKAADKEGRALDLAALQSAEATRTAEASASAKFRQKEMELRNKLEKLGPGEKLYDREGNVVASGMGQPVKGIPANVFNSLTQDAKNTIMGLDQTIKGVPKSVYDKLSESDQQKLLGVKAVQDLAVKGIPRDIYDGLSDEAKAAITNPNVKGVPAAIFNQLTRAEQMKVIGADADSVSGIPRAIFDGLDDDDKRKVLLGAQSAEEKIKDIPKSVFDELPDALQSQILGGVITVAKGHKVIDISEEGKPKVIAEGKGETRVLSPGQIVVDENNNTVAEGPAKQLVDDVVKYISDSARIDDYANNRLGDKTAEFEQQVLDYVSKPAQVWDGKNYIPGDAPKLSRQLMAAIQTRAAAGLSSILDQLPSSIIAPVKKVTDGLNESENAVTEIPDDITSQEFNNFLFAEDGSVDLNSPAWDKIPTNIVDKELNYPGSTGLASGYQRFKNFFAENLRELGGSGLSEEGKKQSRADADLIAIRNELLTYSTSGGLVGDSDRILKMVQEQLMDETNKLTPGMFTTDETALSKLLSVEEKLAANLQVLAQRVPEYGGNRGSFSEQQVIQARSRLGMLKNLVAEIRTMRIIYEKALTTGALGLNPEQRAAAKNWLKGDR